MQRRFSSDELEYIKANYPSESIYTIKNHLKCSWDRVNNAIEQLGLKVDTQSRKPWSKEEETRLREYATKYKVAKIASLLDRTETAIQLHCRRQGIILLKHKRPWNEEDDSVLRELWGTMSLARIAIRLSRSQLAVKVRVQRLGLGSFIENEDNFISASMFCELLGISRGRLDTLEKYGLRINNRRYSAKRSYKVVDIEEAQEFLENHKSLFDASKVSDLLFIPEPDWLRQKRKEDIQTKDNIQRCYRYSAWTNQEISYLTSMINMGMNLDYIEKRMDRSRVGILYKVRRLGLKLRSQVLWVDKEVEYLKSHYMTETDKEIAKELGRTMKSIQAKRKELGLKKRGRVKKG